MTSIYDFDAKTIDGKSVKIDQWRGKTLIVVNVASQCGLTPQYAGLEDLYKAYKDRGLVVLGFPCNQFGGQEPGTEAEIVKFCETKFNVSFPLFSKVDVNGSNTHPLFSFLKSEAPGILGTELIKWNFTKFLVDKNGNFVKRFGPTETPESMKPEIESIL
ncbi:MAG: glutathione peroxidase [Proteobacteria bacterium]|nr:glutathione peroxidase [Pseudomonadota bacterium]